MATLSPDASTVCLLADALLAAIRPEGARSRADRELIALGAALAERTQTGDLREKYRGRP